MFIRRRGRDGFTMVEVVVVVGVIMTLSAMVFLLGSGIQQRDRVTQAAGDLQGWFKMAQVWALRDQRQYGVRLIGANSPSKLVTQVVFIEQPEDYVPPNGEINLNAGTATASSGSFNPSIILGGDFLEVYSGANAKVFRIQAVAADGSSVTLLPAWSGAPTTTKDFRIIRQPKQKDGEPIYQLPQGVAIDLNTNSAGFPGGGDLPPHGANLDIVFGPDGRVLTPGTTGKDIKFWVRDTLDDTEAAPFVTNRFLHTPLIVAVSVRTGMIAVHPIFDQTDPYRNTRDGRSSGF